MRIWKGTEREDREGKMTLFVEASVVNEHVVDVVAENLQQHPDVRRIYFGAGGVDGENALLFVVPSVPLSKLHVDEIVAEVRHDRAKYIESRLFDKLIVTMVVDGPMEKIVPKIQTNSVLKVFKEDLKVDFSEVENGCYNNDVEIYKE